MARTLVPSLLAAGVGLVMACTPAGLDVLGKRCAVDRPCPAPYACVAGVCASPPVGVVDGGSTTPGGTSTSPPDAGPLGVNLLVNPGFEASNPLEGWNADPGTNLTVFSGFVHSGSNAASLSSAGGMGTTTLGLHPSAAPVSSSAAGAYYCASAWVFGSGVAAVLAVEEGPPASPSATASAPAGTSNTWTQLRVVRQADGGEPLTVHLTFQGTQGNGMADDFQLWVSASTQCPEL